MHCISSTKLEQVGILALRGYLLCSFAAIPAFLIWWNMEGLLLMAGQPEDVARLAGRSDFLFFLFFFSFSFLSSFAETLTARTVFNAFISTPTRFLKWFCLATPPLVFVEVARRFFQCQNIVKCVNVVLSSSSSSSSSSSPSYSSLLFFFSLLLHFPPPLSLAFLHIYCIVVIDKNNFDP